MKVHPRKPISSFFYRRREVSRSRSQIYAPRNGMRAPENFYLFVFYRNKNRAASPDRNARAQCSSLRVVGGFVFLGCGGTIASSVKYWAIRFSSRNRAWTNVAKRPLVTHKYVINAWSVPIDANSGATNSNAQSSSSKIGRLKPSPNRQKNGKNPLTGKK